MLIERSRLRFCSPTARLAPRYCAGNLLMLRDGRVAFIDFGIVGAIPRSTADAMLDLVKAFPAGDMLGVGRALEQMGFTESLSPEQSANFAKVCVEIAIPLMSSSYALPSH